MRKAVILLKRLEFTAIYDAYRKVRLFFYNSGLRTVSQIVVKQRVEIELENQWLDKLFTNIK